MLALLLFIIFQQSLCQYETSWTIPLARSPSSFRIASSGRSNHQHILLGFPSGQFEVIDAHVNSLVKSMQLLNEEIRQIEIDSQHGICFVVGSINMVQLDHQYNIRKVFNLQKNISHLTLSKLNLNRNFAVFQSGTRIYSMQYFQGNANISEIISVWESDSKYEAVEMSSNLQYVYTVTTENLFKIQKVFPILDNQTNRLQLQKFDVLQRKFSFKIDRLLLDRKQNIQNDEQLLLITEDETIFYIRAGNIVTYIPYKVATNQHLIAAEICQNGFISIIHERIISKDYSEYFLTLIRKDTLFSHKVILLNQMFGQMNGIERYDCNHNLIVIQSKEKELYVLQSFKVFQIEEYLTQILLLLAIAIIIFCLFCRKASQPDSQKNSESESQNEKHKSSIIDRKQPLPQQQIKQINKSKKKKSKNN